MKSIIKTDRLELKTPELYMAHEVFNLITQNREYFNNYLPWVKSISTINDIETMIDGYINAFINKSEFRYYIFCKKRDKIIGSITIRNINLIARQAELGFWLDYSETGNGYIIEAYNALDVERIKIDKIIANTFSYNLKSMKTLKRLGFHVIKTKENINQFIKLI
ncbi:GNAT family N-acetyltransferase [Staphylococcus pseudintermedius]|uniref:GNAT family N-acetyltransferase n=1 Tax=Staphylococcus pseudintermedius TaxID=283734 RepID=UPI00288889E8|nr:GNAT family N-acetyltransferase [Staphylococcus pseudintermedius]MDT0855068.1 GNAT family N-acetyltransferase [Staphylococcus pseudintermedius]MDT0886014.1 GNAT family N-acetyltransferase [Staphylococcus pseudintermedius]HAR6206664.1 GNAT family N-acetyltransferase [Staphylococcus pseudintermedius]